ncbi:MAG: HAMP domain-containing sensor histidine kinase [Terriglobia bacterium]
MRSLPLRVRLTAWYFGVLIVTFSIFGVTAFIAMRKSIATTVSERLHEQMESIGKLVQERAPKGQQALKHELAEHGKPHSGAGMFQVSDQTGNWVYRSPSMARYDVPAAAGSDHRIISIRRHGAPLRILGSKVSAGDSVYFIQVASRMGDYDEALARFGWVLLLASPLLLILASLGGYWISQRALQPVGEIIQAAQSISVHSLSKRLHVPQSHDELQRLSETLNEMLGRLEAAFKRITQFTADASHELRTPIALMRTRAEVSLRKTRNEGEYREGLAQILRELERTSDLIEKLMLLARADSGVEALHPVRLNLLRPLREACREGQTLAEMKQVIFSQAIPDDPIWVQGDAQSLHRLFLVLIDNAVKYTPGQGQVAVAIAQRDSLAVAEIRDTGIGIGREDLPHIFERFYRSDRARSRKSGGAGLGLSIARWIAEAHHGSIEVESSLHEGSTFRVQLPMSAG